MRRLALAAGLTMLCACASQGSSDLGLTGAPPTTAVSTTAVVATSSTVAPTVPPTEPPATTEPPTTVPASMSKEDQVRADFETARLARRGVRGAGDVEGEEASEGAHPNHVRR